MASIDRLARRIADMERTLRDMAATPQLASSSIVDGAIDQVQTVDTGVVDEFGNPVFEERVVARFGQQGDGGNTVVTFEDPQPPAPSMPTVTPGPGFMVVGWDGVIPGAEPIPSFVRAVGVFVGLATDVIPSAETLRAELPPTGEGTEVTIGSLPPGEYLVSLVAMSHSGRWSEPAPYRVGGPGTSASAVLIQEAIDRANAADARAVLAINAATEADRRAVEAAALADAVSAAANQMDAKAIEALRKGDVSFLAADGKTTVTYSLNPPGAAGEAGDTWFQVDSAGVVLGFWECTSGDGATPEVPAATTVTPAAPTFMNRPGTSLDSYTIPASAGVTYLIDSTPKAAGTYTDRDGPVAVAAVAQPGYVFPSTARVAWVGTLAVDGSGVRDPVAVTGEPVFTDADGPDNDTVELFPFSPAGGASWEINGAPAAEGVHSVSGSVTVEAIPGELFTFGSAQTVWQRDFDPLRHVTAAAPTFTDRSGTAQDTVTVPASPGVAYRVGTVLRSPGTYPASGSVTVTAAPEPGYAIDGATSWSHEFSDVVNPDTEVTAAAPTFTDLPGVSQDTYTIPSTTGVDYYVEGAPTAAGTYPGSGTVSVTATPQPGYALVGAAAWTYVFSTARTAVTATPPGFTDQDGTANDVVTIPARTGVQYRIGGVDRAAGTYPGSGTVTVTAVAASDQYQISGTASWTFTFDPLAYVTPAAPTFTDPAGAASDTYTIPNQPGSVYSVAGAVKAAGTYPASGTVVVTAAPAGGYAFTSGAVTSWSKTFTQTRTVVTPTAPTFTDQNGTASDAVVIPNVPGVQYSIGGVARAPGSYAASGTVTVTAAAASDAYALASGATASWQFTFDPVFYVTPAAPTWNDTADTYTIPSTTGVDYYVEGAVKPAGTYTVPTGSTIASTTFTGIADGAAWPAPWTQQWTQGASSTATVQASAGQLQAGGLANWASKLSQAGTFNVADTDITYKVTINGTEETFHHLMVRMPPSKYPVPSDGYDLLLQGNGLRLYRTVAWSGTLLGSATVTITRGVAWRVRMLTLGIALQVKVWQDGQSEPAAWMIDVTDTQFASGHVAFEIVGGSATTNYTHTIDDIVVANPSGAQTVDVAVTAQAKPGYAITGGATTTWTHTFS